MRISHGLLNQFAQAIPGSSPEAGDSQIQIPSLVLTTIDGIMPLYKLVGSGGTSDASQNSTITVNRNNIVQQFNTFFTLNKGLYDLDLFLSVRFPSLVPMALPAMFRFS